VPFHLRTFTSTLLYERDPYETEVERSPGHRRGQRGEAIARVPVGRLAEPDDVAKVMEFFVSDLADKVTGQCLNICEGAIRF